MNSGGTRVETGSGLARRVQALQDQLDELETAAQIYEEAYWELRAIVDEAREQMVVAANVTDREWVATLPVCRAGLAQAV